MTEATIELKSQAWTQTIDELGLDADPLTLNHRYEEILQQLCGGHCEKN